MWVNFKRKLELNQQFEEFVYLLSIKRLILINIIILHLSTDQIIQSITAAVIIAGFLFKIHVDCCLSKHFNCRYHEVFQNTVIVSTSRNTFLKFAQVRWLMLIIVFNECNYGNFQMVWKMTYNSELLSIQITGYQQFVVSYILSTQPPAYHYTFVQVDIPCLCLLITSALISFINHLKK